MAIKLPLKDKIKYEKEENVHKKKIDKENKHHEHKHDIDMDKAFKYGEKIIKLKKKKKK